ncbi:hypothetical protein SAMN04488688_10881 [Paenibacillus sp. cl141a]|uniref:hypothetical protein n=1 Tax=Paenibacillus sp. cl141a TaxID=1761877 RepID=UPI0008D334D3|nr:hypothetical protein [Paenibacillus sp. cl141a]SEM04633.1 hypothetical protein SAMN04488688_10881 [Paenibacillus sp. cl141a]
MKKILITLIIAIIIFFGIVWISVTSSTAEVIVLKEIKNGEIVVQNNIGEIKTIKAPRIIMKLLHENNEYFIHYNKRRWGKPVLKKIEP